MSGNPDARRSAYADQNAGRFDPRNESAYRTWRTSKLSGYPARAQQLTVEINDPERLTEAERSALQRACRKTNMAVYRWAMPAAHGKAALHAFGRQLGLARLDRNLCADEDGIASIRVVNSPRRGEYIPYSTRPINWHTDGYYNAREQQVRGLIMHCVTAAESGGSNSLLDPEVLYIRLRDRDPAYVAALMEGDIMTIPANRSEGEELRPARSGPVFSVNPHDGSLHMRYTARTRSIRWKDDAPTRAAVAALESVLDAESEHMFRLRLRPGEGILCNNVLHTRDGFTDSAGHQGGRLMWRARYYDRIAQT